MSIETADIVDERKSMGTLSIGTVQFPRLFRPGASIPVREKGVGAVEGFVDFRQVEAVRQGQKFPVHGSAADDEVVFPIVHGLTHGFRAVKQGHGRTVGVIAFIMGQDPMGTAGQDTGQAFKGLAAHEHRVIHGEGLESLQVG